MTYKRILVAVDGSANAARALSTAADLARQWESELVLVHAVMSGAIPKDLLEWARVEHGVDTREEPVPQVDMPGFGRLGVVTHEQASRAPYETRVALGRSILEDAQRRAKDEEEETDEDRSRSDDDEEASTEEIEKIWSILEDME